MSRVINTGIASYGMSGKLFHAPFIEANPHYQLRAIVERHKNESRAKYPQSRLYRSFEEMLCDDDIELVVVNTPVQTHFEYAKAALNAGKKVIVEKPFTVNAEEASVLGALAVEKSLFLSVYQNRRYDGDFLALKEIVDQQLLGELKEAELRFDRYRPGHSGKAHKEGTLPGAGGLHDLGSHLIDQAIQLFGFPQAVFADVFAMRKDMEANDYFELLLYYSKPLRVRIKGTVFAREPYYSYMLHGENGSFLQHRSDLQEQQLLKDVIPSLDQWIETPQETDNMLHATINGETVRRAGRTIPGNYMNYYEDVYHAIANGAPNPVPAADAVLTMRIIDAALQSNKEQKLITL